MWLIRILIYVLLTFALLIPFVISGAGTGITVAIFTELDGQAPWAEIIPFLIMAILPLIFGAIILGVLVSTAPKASPQQIAQLRAEGRTGMARVTSVQATGTLINDVRVYKLNMVVVTPDHAPYRTTVKKSIDPFDAHKFQPGTDHAIVKLRPNAPDVALDPDGTIKPVSASAVAQAREWDDTTFSSRLSGPLPTKPARKRRRLNPVGFLILLVVWGVSAGVAFYIAKDNGIAVVLGESAAREYDGPPFSEDPTVARDVVKAATDEYGSEVSEILLYDDYAIITVRSQSNPELWDRVTVRGGDYELTYDGAAPTQPEAGEYFDADMIDWNLILPAIPDAGMAELPSGDIGEVTQDVRVDAPDNVDLTRFYWQDGVPNPRDLELYDDDSFEFFNDMTKDEAIPQMEKLIAEAPTAQVNVSIRHDYGSIYVTGNSRGEILEVESN